MTAALAYNATSQVPLRQWGEGEGAAEELAVVWAVVQFAESMPASVEDRRALERARASLREVAAALGTDEEGMRELLRRRFEGLRAGDEQARHEPWLKDAPA